MTKFCKNRYFDLPNDKNEDNVHSSLISRENFFGCAKGTFEIPDNFDDIDIESDFEGEIL